MPKKYKIRFLQGSSGSFQGRASTSAYIQSIAEVTGGEYNPTTQTIDFTVIGGDDFSVDVSGLVPDGVATSGLYNPTTEELEFTVAGGSDFTVDVSSLISTVSASNALSIDGGSGDVQLGGTIIKETVITVPSGGNPYSIFIDMGGFDAGLGRTFTIWDAAAINFYPNSFYVRIESNVGTNKNRFQLRDAGLSGLGKEIDTQVAGQMTINYDSLFLKANAISTSGSAGSLSINAENTFVSAEGTLWVNTAPTGQLNIKTTGFTAQNPGDVLTLLDNTTGECNWLPPAGGGGGGYWALNVDGINPILGQEWVFIPELTIGPLGPPPPDPCLPEYDAVANSQQLIPLGLSPWTNVTALANVPDLQNVDGLTFFMSDTGTGAELDVTFTTNGLMTPACAGGITTITAKVVLTDATITGVPTAGIVVIVDGIPLVDNGGFPGEFVTTSGAQTILVTGSLPVTDNSTIWVIPVIFDGTGSSLTIDQVTLEFIGPAIGSYKMPVNRGPAGTVLTSDGLGDTYWDVLDLGDGIYGGSGFLFDENTTAEGNDQSFQMILKRPDTSVDSSQRFLDFTMETDQGDMYSTLRFNQIGAVGSRNNSVTLSSSSPNVHDVVSQISLSSNELNTQTGVDISTLNQFNGSSTEVRISSNADASHGLSLSSSNNFHSESASITINGGLSGSQNSTIALNVGDYVGDSGVNLSLFRTGTGSYGDITPTFYVGLNGVAANGQTMTMNSQGLTLGSVFGSYTFPQNSVAGTLQNDGAGNTQWTPGFTGTFQALDGSTVTVSNGLITSVV